MAQWSSAYITALPDSAFACIDSSGRHYPHHNAAGNLDMAHLRNAMSRVAQEGTTSCGKAHLMAHARAEGMMKTMDFLKAEQLGSNKWRVLAIPFGGEFKGNKDIDGEFFSPRTDIKSHWFKERPVLFHHGMDQLLGAEDIGIEDELKSSPEGWWANIWLHRSHQYHAVVDALLRAGKMYGSSGSAPNLVKTDRKTGEILVWPHIEQTLTPKPSNRLSVVTAAKAMTDYESAGIDLDPAVKALLLTDLDATSDDTDDEPADLRTDLPSGGEDAAMQDETIVRLRGAVAQLEELIKHL